MYVNIYTYIIIRLCGNMILVETIKVYKFCYHGFWKVGERKEGESKRTYK